MTIDAVVPRLGQNVPVWKATPTQPVLLEDISWGTYQQLLDEYEEHPNTHFTYDQGRLEIMVLSANHERKSEILSLLVTVFAEELDVDTVGFGSTAFQRADLQKGFEPDGCFYIQNEAAMRNKLDIDLTIDPPPDLIIEIDITSPSPKKHVVAATSLCCFCPLDWLACSDGATLNKFPVFAALGIREIWRYDGEHVQIWSLMNNNYEESAQSLLLPVANGTALTQLLEMEPGMRRTVWLRHVRSWVREQLQSQ